MAPLITVIIPHHNIPKLLERCLNSIPDTNNVEVIVVDDNSNADIVDFAEFPGKNRRNVTIFLTKEGKGAGYARNVGLKHAKGKWLLFADADDYFTKDAFDIIESYAGSIADMILFKALSVDSETLKESNRNERINNIINLCIEGKITSKNASLSVQVPWCRMIRHSVIKEHSIEFDEVVASNDTMFTTKMSCLANNIEVSEKVLYVVTYRNGSLWDQRKSNPQNYLVRLEVQIRRNRYLSLNGYPKTPILGWVIKSIDLGFLTFLKAICLSVRYNALFDGFSQYLKQRV